MLYFQSFRTLYKKTYGSTALDGDLEKAVIVVISLALDSLDRLASNPDIQIM